MQSWGLSSPFFGCWADSSVRRPRAMPLPRAILPDSSRDPRSGAQAKPPKPSLASRSTTFSRTRAKHGRRERPVRARLGGRRRPADGRHRAGDQQAPEITLTHLRYPAELRPPPGRVLAGNQAQPGREVPAVRKLSSGGAKAWIAIAHSGPIPGILISRTVCSSSRARSLSSCSSSAIFSSSSAS